VDLLLLLDFDDLVVDLLVEASLDELTCVVSLFESSAYEVLVNSDAHPILVTVRTPAKSDAANLLFNMSFFKTSLPFCI
jgi:hypothetical protein